MKIPSRIIVPVLLATSLAGLLMAFLWWQLTQSTQLLSNRKAPENTSLISENTDFIDTPIDLGDAALIHLRQGDLFALRGEWGDAQEEYEQSVKAEGGLPALRKLAQAQLQRRDLKGVRSTLKKLKSAGARSEDILLLETIIKLRIGELVESRTLLEAAKDSPQKHYGLALIAMIQGNHEQATQELTLVINGWDPILRSYARTIQAAYDEYTLFQESSDAHLITLLSRALAQVQECELAIPLLLQVTQQKDNYRDAWIVQGYCELVTERPDQALASLEQAYSLDPQKPEIQYFLARSYSDLYEYQNAITFLEYALTNGFEPQSEARRLIAQNALEIGNTELALEQYDAMTQDPNSTIEAYQGAIAVYLSLDRQEEAYVKAKESTEKWEKDARAYDLLAEAALALERTDEARAALERALEINPYLESAKKRLENI